MRARATRRLGMDLMMMLFLAMGAILYMILPLINIPEKEINQAPPPQGNLMVEMYWADHLVVDVDLWVQAPGDFPVGYSNKGSVVFNLLRDDLGMLGDLSGRNMEIAYTRGIPDGEYVVNAHLYNLKTAELPVDVRVVVAAKEDDNGDYKQLFVVNGQLIFAGQEKTMARFRMKDNQYVPDSFSTLKKKLRSERGGE